MAEPKIKLSLFVNRHGVLDFPEAYLIEYYEKEVKVAIKPPKEDKPKTDDNPKTDDKVNKEDASKTEKKEEDNDVNMKDNNAETPKSKDDKMDIDKDAPKSDDKMDTDKPETSDDTATNDDKAKENNNDKEESEKPKEKKKPEIKYKMEKKKAKSTRQLKVSGSFFNVPSTQKFNAYYELEAQYLNTDRIVHETGEAKNNLESFIYDTRDKFEGGHKDYIQQKDLESLKQKLENFEDWLYEDGENANKSAYNKKLDELQKIVNPVTNRKNEYENRGNRVENFKKLIFTYIRFADSEDKKYSHIEKEKKEEVKKKAESGDKWLMDLLIKQDKKKKWEEPIFKCVDIDNKYRELMNECNPIVNTPIPKPKEVPKKDEKKDKKDDDKVNGDKQEETNNDNDVNMEDKVKGDENNNAESAKKDNEDKENGDDAKASEDDKSKMEVE